MTFWKLGALGRQGRYITQKKKNYFDEEQLISFYLFLLMLKSPVKRINVYILVVQLTYLIIIKYIIKIIAKIKLIGIPNIYMRVFRCL